MRTVFAALGKVADGKRLSPEALSGLPEEGAILNGHRVAVSHLSARDLDSKRGQYRIEIIGPSVDGRWAFRQGELDKLARDAWSANVR